MSGVELSEVELLYTELWSLIPDGPDKRPLVPWRAYQHERASLEQVRQWAHELRPSIWAGVTGAVSGRISLDFDGEPALRTLEKLGLDPHRLTPNGGAHVDIVAPMHRVPTVNGRSKKLLGERYPGVDVRGDGGYINLLGATATGEYQWDGPREPYPLEVVDPDLAAFIGLAEPEAAPQPVETISQPVQFRSGLAPSLQLPPAVSGDTALDVMATLHLRALEQAVPGARNDAGFWLACQLRDHGLSFDDAWTTMYLFARSVPVTNGHGAAEPYTEAEAFASLRSAYGGSRRAPWLATLPQILARGRQLREVAEDAVDALVAANDPPRLFDQGGTLVRLVIPRSGAPRVQPLTPDGIKHELSVSADWVKPAKKEEDDPVPTFPPTEVARDLSQFAYEFFPNLRGIMETPTIRPEGTLLTATGYDAISQFYLAPPQSLVVPSIADSPTDAQVGSARSLLVDDLLGDFPFVDAASTANAVALLITPLVPLLVDDLVPLALLSAPTPGSGKTIMVDIVALIATGRNAQLTAAPDGNDEELRKRITALLLGGQGIIAFDNCTATLSSSVLSQALTAQVWQDRLLGHSKALSLPQRATWIATGNNIQLGGDLPRRAYAINLDPQTARPEERAFRHTDLGRWVLEHRGELIAAVLALARHWICQGSPPPALPPWGSYNRWSQTVGGILATAGIDGFLANRLQLRSREDQDALAWTSLLRRCLEQLGPHPVRVGRIDAVIVEGQQEIELPRSLAESLSTARDDNARRTRLANKLRSIEGRRFDDTGIRIERAGEDRTTKTLLWRVTDSSDSTH